MARICATRLQPFTFVRAFVCGFCSSASVHARVKFCVYLYIIFKFYICAHHVMQYSATSVASKGVEHEVTVI